MKQIDILDSISIGSSIKNAMTCQEYDFKFPELELLKLQFLYLQCHLPKLKDGCNKYKCHCDVDILCSLCKNVVYKKQEMDLERPFDLVHYVVDTYFFHHFNSDITDCCKALHTLAVDDLKLEHDLECKK